MMKVEINNLILEEIGEILSKNPNNKYVVLTNKGILIKNNLKESELILFFHIYSSLLINEYNIDISLLEKFLNSPIKIKLANS